MEKTDQHLSRHKDLSSVVDENANVEEGKKAIQAANVANPKPPAETNKEQERDAEQWRNEG